MPQAAGSCRPGPGAVITQATQATGIDEDSFGPISLPFDWVWDGVNYRSAASGGVFVNSNSYVTFGGASRAFFDLGPSSPELRTLHVGSGDGSWSSVQVESRADRVTAYFEGWSWWGGQGAPADVQWAATWFPNHTMALCVGSTHFGVFDQSRSTGLSNGRGSWLASFSLDLFTWTAFDIRWVLAPGSGCCAEAEAHCDQAHSAPALLSIRRGRYPHSYAGLLRRPQGPRPRRRLHQPGPLRARHPARRRACRRARRRAPRPAARRRGRRRRRRRASGRPCQPPSPSP